jgi:hypothetical protein
MGVIRNKLFRDIWVNKGRTLQIVLIIGIGAASIGMIMGTRNLVVPGMQEMWTSIEPAMINIFVGPPVNEDELEVLRRTEGVEYIEGINNETIEWRLNPEDEWQQGGLNARADYQDMQLNKLEIIEGSWPEDEVMAINQGDDVFFQIPKNGQVYLKIDGKEHLVDVAGVV